MRFVASLRLALLVAAALSSIPSPSLAAARPKAVVLSIKPIDEETRKPAQVLTEVIVTELGALSSLEILGETELGSMIGFERQRELLGCTDGTCMAQLGGALGCDYLIMGTLGRVGKQLRLDLRLADVRKNVILARDGAAVRSPDDLVDAARKSLQVLVRALPARPGAAAPRSEVRREASPGRGPLPWVLVAGGGALAIGGGVLTAVTVKDKASLTFDQAQTRSTLGLVTAGVGLAALATGIVLFSTGGPGAGEPSAAVTLSASPDGAGLLALGRF